jgi:uncharacterized membrane protein
MTETSASNTVAEGWPGHNVIAVSFEDDQNAYKALTALKELDSQERVRIVEAVVVERGEDGQLIEKDRVESKVLPGAASGGLTGLLLGVLGGPLGVLVGGTYGLFVGSLFDLSDISEADSALAQVSGSARLGHTALLAVVDEGSREVVDTAMSEVDGTVVRRTVADVEAELAAAESAQRKAKREARKELMRERQEHDNAAVQAKLDELKTKLRHGGQAETGDGERSPATAATTS